MKNKQVHIWRAALAALLLIVTFAGAVHAKTVGIWQDHRSYISAGLTNALIEAGWDIEWFSANRGKNDLENREKLAKTDVMLFCGGWNAYFFPSPKARLELIRYAATGKGILLSGFRSGYVRTANRPMFPEIGEVYNRCSSSWIGPEGNSPLAKAFKGKKRCFSGNDHLCIRIGKNGTLFCSSGGDPVGAFGEFYHGRVIVFGGNFLFQVVDDTREHTERLLMASLKYLTGGSKPSPEEAALASRQAESEFIRREIRWTYTADDRGPDRRPGLLTALRDNATSKPEAIAFKLEYFASQLPANDKDRGRCISNANVLKSMVARARGAYNQELKNLDAKIATADPSDLALSLATGGKFVDLAAAEKAINRHINTNSMVAAIKLIDSVRPKINALRRAALEKEIAEDLKKVPGILAQFASPCGKTRYEAALEIGRISPTDDASAEALIALLDDADERVREQAVISLGWMQAKKAVPALVEKTLSSDKFMRRRSVQALGLIGDEKAVPALLKAADSKDILTRICAVTALGHLKATAAVTKLLAIAEDPKANEELKAASILALGDIGDKRAQKSLEKLNAEAKPLPRDRGGVHTNYLSSKHPLQLKTSTQIALERIAEGGRAEKGVKQPEEYRSYDTFYAITKNCNAFVGRTETVRGAFQHLGQKELWAFVKKAGFTGVHNAWGWPRGWDPKDFTEVVREAGEMGLVWIDVQCGYGRVNYAVNEAVVSHYEKENISAFRGIWSEETWPELGGTNEEFIKFIEERYGSNWAEKLALSELEKNTVLNMPYKNWIGFGTGGPNKPLEAGFAAPWNGALRTLVIEFNGKLLDDSWRESQGYLHARRKGSSQTYVISTADPTKVIGGIKAAERLDSLGHESYECFGRFSAYYMERYRNGGAARSVMSEQYNWYCPSNEHALRGFWQNAIHSKCYYNFALHQIFEQPSWYDNWSWENGRWATASQVFNRVRKTPEYYTIKPSAANAAVIFSERSSSAVKEQVYFQCSIPTRNDHNTMAAWTALNQSHIPCDVLWAESLDARRLAKYRFIYIPSAKYLADNEIEAIREWVKAGGTLVAEGTTSLFSGNSLKLRRNYALADVFGCDWVKTEFRTGDDSDTYATRHGSKVSAFKVVPGLDSPLHIDDSIHRDAKPEESLATAEILEGVTEIAGLEEDDRFEFDAALGYDIVKPAGAKVLARYSDCENPAVLFNRFGKGRCYFITANYFAHAHVTSRWEMMPGHLDFWKNVRELLAGMVSSSFEATGATLPVRISGASIEVELSVDDHGDKYVVHLLDYDVKSQGVKGVTLTVPGSRQIKRVFYPGDKKDLPLDGRTVALRDFKVYDMLVVEFKD